jgi:hypothetical protein
MRVGVVLPIWAILAGAAILACNAIATALLAVALLVHLAAKVVG